MKKWIWGVIAFMLMHQVYAEKYALIIAVGDYPKESGWRNISSKNDVALIKGALRRYGFPKQNISTLINSQAYKQAILLALRSLQAKLQQGDVVVIHFSGHGQLIFDDNGDELDGLDEALVPYDAKVRYTAVYKGENHIRDDDWGKILTAFRNTLGNTGNLLVLIDSCHSGSLARGGSARGGQPLFAPPNWIRPGNNQNRDSFMYEADGTAQDLAPFVMISGASADELNYEYRQYGSLSFAFSRALQNLENGSSYRQLFAHIQSTMNIISPKQTPILEGDADYEIFGGDYVSQERYYEVTAIKGTHKITINAGRLNGLFKGTTVTIMPAGSRKIENEKRITTGTLMETTYTSATLALKDPLPDTNESKYWVFVNTKAPGLVSTQVYIHPSIDQQKFIKGIQKFLQKEGLGELTKDSLMADIMVHRRMDTLRLSITNGLLDLAKYPFDLESMEATVTEVNQHIYGYAYGKYLKEVSLENRALALEFRLLPFEENKTQKKDDRIIAQTQMDDASGIFKVRPYTDRVRLQVENLGTEPFYFTIVEINSKGQVAPFLPNKACPLNDQERLLAPGQKQVLQNCLWRFAPPYERLVLKGFATKTPLYLQDAKRTRGGAKDYNNSPLRRILVNNGAATRGNVPEDGSDTIDGYTATFLYEIIKK